jgi:hypothetical protein
MSNGGLIGINNIPTKVLTSGIWSMFDTYYSRLNDIWPTGNNLNIEAVIVAGGGGGPGNFSAGGGAGGLRAFLFELPYDQTFPIVIGGGGSGGIYVASGVDGSDSSFNGKVSTGGGAGVETDNATARNGGSGGGGANSYSNSYPGGLGNTPATTPSQGNNGGSSANFGWSNAGAGGGGGAGSAGGDASNLQAGAGGAGIVWNGFSLAGGGGAGGALGYAGTQPGSATHGGGAGKGNNVETGDSGTPNTGGGGGSGGAAGGDGGNGGSGVVIIRYLSSIQLCQGGNSIYASGGYWYHIFNTSSDFITTKPLLTPSLYNKLENSSLISEIGPNGVVHGSVSFVPAKYGNGVSITTETLVWQDGVDFSNNPSLVNNVQGCIEMWVKATQLPNWGHVFVSGLHSELDLVEPILCFWSNLSGEDQLNLYMQFGGSYQTFAFGSFSSNFPLNVDNHFALVWNRNGINSSSDIIRIYVNDTIVYTSTTAATWGTTDNAGGLRFGSGLNHVNDTIVDNVKAYQVEKVDFSDRLTE